MRRIGKPFFVRNAVSALCTSLIFICGAGARPNVTAPIGVVVSAQGAQISQVDAVNGTSLYPHDTISTGVGGALRVRFGSSQLTLGPSTAVKLEQNERAIAAILQRGIVRFAAAGVGIEFQALDHVIVRAQGDAASGEFAVVSSNEFQIACTRGALIVEIDGVQRIVAESTSYDVTLKDAPDYDAQHAGHRKKLAVWIAISAILIATGVGLYLANPSCGTALSCSKFQ
jgi:hypothetical protein